MHKKTIYQYRYQNNIIKDIRCRARRAAEKRRDKGNERDTKKDEVCCTKKRSTE